MYKRREGGNTQKGDVVQTKKIKTTYIHTSVFTLIQDTSSSILLWCGVYATTKKGGLRSAFDDVLFVVYVDVTVVVVVVVMTDNITREWVECNR